MQNPVDISIVIVNYNVKEFLSNLLNAIKKAQHGLKLEVFVVDNASADDSVSYLKKQYPDAIYIENERNLGFGKANNQAISQANGKYTLLINPDTLISEDTLTVMKRYMDRHPETGVCGCKILNPDGTFAPESRRSIPTPLSALWKVLGLTALFPHNKTFAEYYLSWMDENKPSQVPVLSGAFMFYRTQVLKELEGFDERFFMYGEDIDLCYRTSKSGYRVDYIPDTSIIHYKGESTRKDNIDYIVLFNRAMLQFFRKHYSYSYSLFLRFLVTSGIVIRGAVSYLSTLFRKGAQPLIDLCLINLILLVGFIWRFQVNIRAFFAEYQSDYFIVNIAVSLLFIIGAINHEVYGKNRNSIVAVLKACFWAFGGTSLITFFLRQFAFSRLVLLVGFGVSFLALAALRVLRKNRGIPTKTGRGSFNAARVLIVGLNDRTVELARKLQGKIDKNYEVIGVLNNEKAGSDETMSAGLPLLGRIDDIPRIIDSYRVDQVLFLLNTLSYKEILHIITKFRRPDTTFRIVPESLDFIIGKANVEYLADLPVVDVEIAYQTPWNRFIKRLFDICLAVLLLVIAAPVMLPVMAFSKSYRQKEHLFGDPSGIDDVRLFSPVGKNALKNIYLLLGSVLKGKISFVGAPFAGSGETELVYKPGLTGLRQINESRLFHRDDKLRYEIYYLQNYSIWMDIDILIKSCRARSHSLRLLTEETVDFL